MSCPRSNSRHGRTKTLTHSLRILSLLFFFFDILSLVPKQRQMSKRTGKKVRKKLRKEKNRRDLVREKNVIE